ncbi:IclR family transcriptional regulator [Dactylosporangium sp. CA-092794]|uniref:IclR family transcriptional regulator n=1 Tax=Dactylosporangium sp. CA-092794 TaxID=3239929 RepID=UPI003D8FC913
MTSHAMPTPQGSASGEPPAGLDSSVGKALALLDALAGPRPSMGVSDLADVAGMPKSTAHRLLMVLISGGYVRRVAGKYALSSRVFEVGSQSELSRVNGLTNQAMPYMAELFAQTHETIHLAVRRGTDVLYVEKLFGHQSIRIPTFVGARHPAYASALGKAMLAFSPQEDARLGLPARYRRLTAYTICTPDAMQRSLRRVGEERCATDHEESFLGVWCIAVPILDRRTHHAVAAFSLTTGVGNGAIQRYRKLLMRAGEELSSALYVPAAA